MDSSGKADIAADGNPVGLVGESKVSAAFQRERAQLAEDKAEDRPSRERVGRYCRWLSGLP